MRTGTGLERTLTSSRRVALTMLLLVACAYFLTVVNRHYPIRHWLFWRYASYWLILGAWTFGCLAAGHRVLRAVLRRSLRFQEQLLVSMAIGVLLSFMLTFVAGLLHLFGTLYFFALPILMSAVGGRGFVLYVWRYARRRRRIRVPSVRPLNVLFTLLGVLGAGMVYFQILSPENVGFDARWYHIPIGESYWAAGGIGPFREGWYPSTQPHLTSVLFAWAFQIPGSVPFDQVELCLHMEFCFFLWSLVGINVLVARCIGRGRAPFAWVIRFAFPGTFLYGSTLNGGADHVCAALVPPTVLALLYTWRSLSVAWAVLLSVFVATIALTKTMTTLMVAPPIVLGFLLRALWLASARFRKQPTSPNWWKAPLLAALAGLAVSAPYWLKNWIWYGDPVFPLLARAGVLHSPLWTERGAEFFAVSFQDDFWRPAPGKDGWLDTAKVLFTFSFEPHDWAERHGKTPVVGSLFTLLTLLLPFTKPRSWRAMGLTVIALFGIAAWYRMNHQDRYLQGILPLLAAATGAALVLIWREHLVARAIVGLLVGAQVVWGGDVYFIRTHAMSTAPLQAVNELLESGYRKNYKDRLWPYFSRGFREHLPKGATVLFHRVYTSTGIGAHFVVDDPRMQPAISWEDARDPGDVWDTLRRHGVSHVISDATKSDAWVSLRSDLLFYAFIQQHGHDAKHIGSYRVTTVPQKRPTGFKHGDHVAYLGCDDSYLDGLYRVTDLDAGIFRKHGLPAKKDCPEYAKPRSTGSFAELLGRASFAVVQPKCASEALPLLISGGFQRAITRNYKGSKHHVRREQIRPTEIWIRQ